MHLVCDSSCFYLFKFIYLLFTGFNIPLNTCLSSLSYLGRGEAGISIPLGDPNQLNEFLSDQGGSDHTKHHGDLHYLFDAVMPFLQVQCEEMNIYLQILNYTLLSVLHYSCQIFQAHLSKKYTLLSIV